MTSSMSMDEMVIREISILSVDGESHSARLLFLSSPSNLELDTFSIKLYDNEDELIAEGSNIKEFKSTNNKVVGLDFNFNPGSCSGKHRYRWKIQNKDKQAHYNVYWIYRKSYINSSKLKPYEFLADYEHGRQELGAMIIVTSLFLVAISSYALMKFSSSLDMASLRESVLQGVRGTTPEITEEQAPE